MTENLAVADAQKPHQYGDNIKQPGEPFNEATLDTIRALLAESDPVPEPRPLSDALPFGLGRQKSSDTKDDVNIAAAVQQTISEAEKAAPQAAASDELRAKADQSALPEVSYYEERPKRQSWRKIEVVEGRTGRNLRRFLMSPRMVSVIFLCGVVAWQPWFIPMLALLIVSSLLLVGALIGQDRMARIVLFFLKRFVWSDPALGRFLQRVLPHRWHGVLYRPATEEDAWDGPIDPSFEARLSRLRS